MFYERRIYKDLKKYLKTKQVMVVTGMRRTGKTTLLKQLLSEIKSDNKIYFDLEQINDRAIFDQKDYNNVLLELKNRKINLKQKIYIAIDEIQFLTNIPSVIKYLYDHYDIKFIVSGSSSYYLKNLFSQSLSGRKFIFEIFPLDFGEFLVFKGIILNNNNPFKSTFSEYTYERIKFYYEEYISFGGFPEVVLTEDREQKEKLLIDIISSYINIDIKSLADFRKDKQIHDLIKILATRVGTRIDYNKLCSLVGISRHTLEEYMNFFEKTYLIYRVSVHTNNVDREIVKAQKLYFCDNGIINVLSENSSGSQFENALFNQLKQLGDVRYYSLKNGNEIDFIFDKKIALEAKESPTNEDLNNLAKISKIAGIKKHRLIGRHSVPKFTDYVWGGEIN